MEVERDEEREKRRGRSIKEVATARTDRIYP